MKTFDFMGKTDPAFDDFLSSRVLQLDKKLLAVVSDIIDDVRENGDDALRRYADKFDGGAPVAFEVPREQIEDAFHNADHSLIIALQNARDNIREFHEKQKREGFEYKRGRGMLLGQLIRPIARVGVYVPGGTAAYPSTVLMDVVPAKIAGVRDIVLITPPGKDGKANPDILTAAFVCGVNRVFLSGGAQAIAALAFGTQTIPRVDKIVGPGNIYVALAKQLLYGVVDIDMIAGPSEVAIVADDNANPTYIAADMLAQAEHDRMASSVLLTTSRRLPGLVEAELERQLETLERADMIRESLDNFGAFVLCDTLIEAFNMCNRIAPEHLEILLDDPASYLENVENAGSVFLGPYSPEPLGDYYAGPNHVLPTNSTARFFSPLSVDSFYKKTSYIQYSKEALSAARNDIAAIARTEGLTAHLNAVEVRFD